MNGADTIYKIGQIVHCVANPEAKGQITALRQYGADHIDFEVTFITERGELHTNLFSDFELEAI